jgi:hypothetical protein
MSPRGWRAVRAILTGRQPALAYLVALAAAGLAIDLGLAELANQVPSFSAFARREFDNDTTWRVASTFGHASFGVRAGLVAAVLGASVLSGWLSTCYLIALGEGRYSLRADRRVVAWFATWWLVFTCFSLAVEALHDHDQDAVGVPLSLVSLPVLLFSQYAIVYGGRGLLGSFADSLRMFRVRPRSAIAALAGTFVLAELEYALFVHSFHDATHVQPGFLAAYALFDALLSFAIDAVLLTMYRDAGLGRSTAAGSAGRAEAPSSSTASD